METEKENSCLKMCKLQLNGKLTANINFEYGVKEIPFANGLCEWKNNDVSEPFFSPVQMK